MSDSNPNTENSPQQALEYLLKKFQLERYVYLALTIISLIILVVCCAAILWHEQKIETIVVLFGSTGVIAYSCSQLLSMWKDCINLYLKYFENHQ